MSCSECEQLTDNMYEFSVYTASRLKLLTGTHKLQMEPSV